MIDAPLAGFLEEGLSIYVGTRDARLRPNGARGLAALVEDGGRHMVVHLAQIAAARLLPDLESNGQIAVSFGRPVDDRACQVKGLMVETWTASDRERAAIEAQWEGFLRQLERIGIPRPATTGWIRWPAVGIRLKVTAVFEQTPGPTAGTPLS